MKKQLILFAALMVSAFASAQSNVIIDNLFTIPEAEKAIELNDAALVKNGIVFVGDTRTPDKITDGKMKGMKVSKKNRYFATAGNPAKFGKELIFGGAPSGSKTDGQIDVNNVPRSRMIQFKPTSSGTISFCAYARKDVGNIYIGVRNGSTFKNLETIAYKKNEEGGKKKENALPVHSCDYQYNAGDEIWIYSDGGAGLFGFVFSGNVDNTFAGSEPNQVSKDVKKARKNK